MVTSGFNLVPTEDILESQSTSRWNEMLILAAGGPSIGYQKRKQKNFGADLGSQHRNSALLSRLLLVFDRLGGLSSCICCGVNLVLRKTL